MYADGNISEICASLQAFIIGGLKNGDQIRTP